MKKVIVIGGGIGGLAIANILAKAGYRVTVLEKNKQLGGRAGLLKKDGFTFDTGPSWYLMPEVFEQYFNLFGISATKMLEVERLSPAYKIYFETDPAITITGNYKKDRALFESIEKGAGEKLDKYAATSKKVYDLALKHFLYTNFKSLGDVVKKDILSNSLKMLGMTSISVDSYASKYFKDHRLKKILEYSMVFLGSSPFKTPAIYSLMSALDFEYGVYYPKKGMYSIIEQMHKIGLELGVSYKTSCDVKKIIVQNGVACGVELKNSQTINADIVISNSDLHHTETKLLEQKYRRYSESYWSKKNPGPSAMLMYLGVRGKLTELEHHTLLFVDDWKTNFEDIYTRHKLPKKASIYISRATATDKNLAPKDHEALVVLVPWPSKVNVDNKTLNEYAGMYLDQIEKTTGINDLKKRIVSRTIVGPNDFSANYYAWQNTALGPAHTLSQSAIFRFNNKSKVKNLYYVGGSTIPGIGLPMCLISAELVYKHIANDKKGGPITNIDRLVM